MSDEGDLEKRLTQLQDSLDSLHHRMDRFYSWAGLLQSEFRDIKQRAGFMETVLHENFDFNHNQQPSVASHKGSEKVFGGEDDSALWARMMRITGKKSEG
jgi:hypothetical protein